MKLTDIDLAGLGEFTEEQAGFEVKRFHLEEPWSYIYTNGRAILRVDHRGPDYLQFDPPSGVVLFRRERFQQHPSSLVWIKTEDGRAFTNFHLPLVGAGGLLEEPGGFSCKYNAIEAIYTVRNGTLSCETRTLTAPGDAAVMMAVRIVNEGDRVRHLRVVPAMRPHFAAFALQPWDVPSLYQTVSFFNIGGAGFLIELRSPSAIPQDRHYALVVSDLAELDAAEVDYERFVGAGSFEAPEALFGRSMSVDVSAGHPFGQLSAPATCAGRQGIVALSRALRLLPGEEFEFHTVMAHAGQKEPPGPSRLQEVRALLGSDAFRLAREELARQHSTLMDTRRIQAPDEALARYANEYLPLQLRWVRLLDRGWPTGMRGVRDCAQDTTALVPIDPAAARQTILELINIQRSDGWFPRQYAIPGRHGQHDLRPYVDGGLWVWELCYEYLCSTGDFEVLDENAGWLDGNGFDSVWQHLVCLISYYTSEHNLGEHGLCLIRGGDWNDSVNRAGLEGRGESVMVSCQLVLMLRQAANLLRCMRSKPGTMDQAAADDLAAAWDGAADRMSDRLIASALNNEGYLNGVFTDGGEWVFSPRDPDGRWRVNVPVNAFGIISGVLIGDARDRVLDVLESLKQTDGWPLFYPGIAAPPIERLGRIGQGDLLPGLGENAGIYNHGCHGFLGRAAAVAGRADLLEEVLRYMLPMYQDAHPVHRSKTAPYGMVNHWKMASGEEGRGGSLFLTGSISTALRNIYGGLFGVCPLPDALALRPVLPRSWRRAALRYAYRGRALEVTYERIESSPAVPSISVEGIAVSETRQDPATGETLSVIPDSFICDRSPEGGSISMLVGF